MAIEPTHVTIDFRGLADKIKGRTREFVVEVVQNICTDIVKATPVKTGFLRSSWYAQIEHDGVAPPPISDTSGGKGLVGAVDFGQIVAEIQIGDVFRFSNGVSYAAFTEYGTSRMAPRMMVRSALLRAQTTADEVAARMARED
jgi:hypothetical protein